MKAVAGSVTTPFGEAARCGARSKATGKQCAKPARRGHKVCGVHGAGHRRREAAGTRKSPRLGKLSTGLRAARATLDTLAEVDPIFAQARAEATSSGVDVMDPQPVLADLWALRRVLLQRVRVNVDEGGIEHAPALLGVLNAISIAQERAARMHQREMDAKGVPVDIVQACFNRMCDIIYSSLPTDQAEALLAKLEPLNVSLEDDERTEPLSLRGAAVTPGSTQ